MQQKKTGTVKSGAVDPEFAQSEYEKLYGGSDVTHQFQFEIGDEKGNLVYKSPYDYNTSTYAATAGQNYIEENFPHFIDTYRVQVWYNGQADEGKRFKTTKVVETDPPFEPGDSVKFVKNKKVRAYWLDNDTLKYDPFEFYEYTKDVKQTISQRKRFGNTNIYLMKPIWESGYQQQNWRYCLEEDMEKYDTGGYTGSWGPEGKFAMLHEKELVLNKQDTENLLASTMILREISQMLDRNALLASLGMADFEALKLSETADQVLQQDVTIHAEFPNVTDHNEIEFAIDNLINAASQHAYRQ